MFHCTGKGHIKEASLLLYLALWTGTGDAWKEIILHTNYIDVRELKSLCRMDSHKANFIIIFLVCFLINRTHKSDVFEESFQK